jgi:hypothetical protein
MSSRFSSTISNAVHCRPSQGGIDAAALFAFEGMYLFIGGKSANVDIFGANAECLNLVKLSTAGGASVS